MMRNPFLFFTAAFSLTVTACSVPVKEFDPPVALAEKFSISGQTAAKPKWWLSFNDPALNQLIEQALSHNFNLKSAFNRFQQAQAIAKKSGAGLIPTLDGSFSAKRNYIKDDFGQQSLNDFAVGLAASYELDLWGRIRANLHAADLDVSAAQEDIFTAAISLSAEVASTWYRLIEQRNQLLLLNKQIAINQDNVTLITTRFKSGQASAADVFQQQQLLQSTIGDQYTIKANIKSLEYQLAVLLGQSPNTVTLPQQTDFPELPKMPDTGFTTDLIQRRPDIRQAYLRVQAADQRIAAAIAERFPKISLSASITTSSPDLYSLFNNWLATLAGNLVIPVIDGRRRVAEVERNEAIFSESMNQYALSILQSIKEVEDALIQESQQKKLLNSLSRQIFLSRRANNQIHNRYIFGAMDFQRLLSAMLNLQSLERNRVTAQRQLIEYRINLYRALAGSWPLNAKTPSINTTEVNHG